MASKKWQVSQKLLLNGNSVTSTFFMYAEKDEVNSLTALLEGGHEVKEVVTDMSDMTKAETPVVAVNPVSAIYLSGAQGQIASIKPIKGNIYFKSTVEVDNIANVLKTTHPFELLPTANPIRVSVRRNETFTA